MGKSCQTTFLSLWENYPYVTFFLRSLQSGQILFTNGLFLVYLPCEQVKAKNIDHLGCHHRFFRFFADFSNLFRTPKMRLRTLVLNYCWISTVLIYFGIALNAPNLSANLFLYELLSNPTFSTFLYANSVCGQHVLWSFRYTCLSGLLEIPSYLMVPPLLKYIGRRVIFSTMLFICGAALGFSLLFEQGNNNLQQLATSNSG